MEFCGFFCKIATFWIFTHSFCHFREAAMQSSGTDLDLAVRQRRDFLNDTVIMRFFSETQQNIESGFSHWDIHFSYMRIHSLP